MDQSKQQIENPGKPEGDVGKTMLERMNVSHAPLRNWAFPLLPWKKNMRILDAGCGGGAAIREMLSLAEEGRIDGIDYAPLSVEESRMLNQDLLGKRVFIQKADILSLPFADDTFDLVTAIETVYFWPDITAAFREVLRTLKPGGTFAICNEGSDPASNSWPKPEGTFMRIYYPEELESFLKSAGFKNVSCARGPEEFICVCGTK